MTEFVSNSCLQELLGNTSQPTLDQGLDCLTVMAYPGLKSVF